METMEAEHTTADDERPSITLGGRQFRRVEQTTVDQDAFVTKRLRDSGISKMLDTFDPKTEPMHALMERIIWEAFERGVLYEILAGTLGEDGVRWSRPYAMHNAKMFAELQSRTEKDALFSKITDFLLDFFRVAAVWSSTSETFLNQASKGGGDRLDTPSPAPLSRNPAQSIAETHDSISASGTD